jgi:Fe-S-cluster containining protein
VAVYTLSIHAGYRCRHSGECCTAGWRIPVERGTERRLVQSGLVAHAPGAHTPLERDGSKTVLALTPERACVFFEPRRDARLASCAIHRVLGHGALPSACRHFPRVAVTDDHGTFVTLSHFCPSAAALLFGDTVPLAIVQPPPSFDVVTEYEGLDARGVLPPLLRAKLLMDLDGHHAWETRVVRVMADEAYDVEAALTQLEHDVERVRAWRPGQETLCERIRGLGTNQTVLSARTAEEAAALYELVSSCVPPGRGSEPVPDDFDAMDAAHVQPAWRDFAVPVKRYLAARAFASWIPWHARDLRIAVRWLAAVRSVLRVEAARECGRSGRRLDRAQLLAAVRRADLLLVHKASVSTVAHRLHAAYAVNRSHAVQAWRREIFDGFASTRHEGRRRTVPVL